VREGEHALELLALHGGQCAAEHGVIQRPARRVLEGVLAALAPHDCMDRTVDSQFAGNA